MNARYATITVFGLLYGFVAFHHSSARADDATEATPAAKAPEGYVDEAPLPEGFPPPCEPGKVVLKDYPQSRTYSATGDKAFWKLFGYLSLQQHKMTAPVIMSYRAPDEAAGEQKPEGEAVQPADVRPAAEKNSVGSRNRMKLPVAVERMHFVLEKPSLDAPKNLGVIKVGDTPALLVLSIASQGDMDRAAIAAAAEKLYEELRQRDAWEAAGPPRLLGYNSPSVPAKQRFWELQLPIQRKAAE